VKHVLVLAFLLPLTAQAQLALFAMNGSTEVPIGATLDLGKVAAGDTFSVRIRLRNTGPSKVDITRFSADGTGFTLDRPSLPFPIAPGSAQDVLLSFNASIPALYSANLQVNTSANSVSAIVLATVVVGPVLTVFPACTGSDGPPASIDFGRVQAGQARLCNFYLRNASTQEMTIATFRVTGSGFQISTGPKAPFKIAAGDTTAFVITFSANAAGLYSGALAIEARTYVLTGAAFDTPLPKPLIEFDAGPIQSAQQRRLTMRLPTAASASVSGILNLGFLPDATLVADDPAIVFLATGTRSLPFSVSQGSTQILINSGTSALFQTGTSSGRIRACSVTSRPRASGSGIVGSVSRAAAQAWKTIFAASLAPCVAMCAPTDALDTELISGTQRGLRAAASWSGWVIAYGSPEVTSPRASNTSSCATATSSAIPPR